MSAFLALLGREIRLALRHPADTLAAVLFFVLVCALFPFGVGPAPETLAPGATLVTLRARFAVSLSVPLVSLTVRMALSAASPSGALRVSSKLWVAVVPVCTAPSFQVTL